MMDNRILLDPALYGHGRGTSWRESAACPGANIGLFFLAGFTGLAVDTQAARAFCGRCPVRDRCLACAVDTGRSAGIWGGRDEYQRKLMRQGRYRYELMPREAARRRP
jgi:WhiB family redox-sensing transcriptional regulator